MFAYSWAVTSGEFRRILKLLAALLLPPNAAAYFF